MGKRIKFVVGNTDKWRSKVWSIKFNKDDVYIWSDSGKDHKITLHASGVCHSAVPQERMAHFNLTPEQRTATRWIVAPEMGEGSIAFTLLVGFDQMSDRSSSALPKEVLRIPTPPICSAAIVLFVRTKAEGKVVNWILPVGFNLLHSETLKSGDNISVLYSYSNAFNFLIDQCKQKLRAYAALVRPKPPMVPSSGFVTAFDSNKNPYHIELKLKQDD